MIYVFFFLLKVTIEENDQEGEVTGSFTPSQVGEHQVSVTFRGKHLQGSPLMQFKGRDRCC